MAGCRALLLALLVAAMVFGRVLGAADETADDDIEDYDDLGSSEHAAAAAAVPETETDPVATFPAECGDLVALVEALDRGTFEPSDSARWDVVRNATWEPTPPVSAVAYGEPGRCDIDRVPAAEIGAEGFFKHYNEQKPVILVNTTNWELFAKMTEKRVLLYCFGDFDVTLSTANKNSYAKTEASFRYYVANMLKPQSLEASGKATKYFFGDNRHSEWDALFKHYEKPSAFYRDHASLSFGVGGSGSGVPFHTHGHVFAEVLHGRKRWFLQEPGPEPRFDPDESSLRWVTYVRPGLESEALAKIQECVCDPGDLLYIPSHWHHSTLNLGESVFMSTFV